MQHDLTIILTAVVAIGVIAQWLSWRVRVPAILLLTVVGLAIGPVLGWLQPSADLGLALEPMIKLAVAIILFEGGFSLRLHELRHAADAVRRLVTVGAVLGGLLAAVAAHYIGGLAWPVSLIFGAISVITGPTVIIPLLRHAHLKRRPASLLKWEGIIIDPLGALVAVLLYQYFVFADIERLSMVLMDLAWSLAVSTAVAGGVGWLLGRAFQHGHVPEYLKAPSLLAAVLVVYEVANLAQAEAGLLAATLLGIVMGNQRLASLSELRRFKEYITILLVSILFVLLSAELDPAILGQLDWRMGLLLAVLVFVVRPAAVWLSTIGAGLSWRERLLVGWIAPRGIVAAAVAGVFAPELAAHGYQDGALLLPLVFGLILVTITLHGASLGWLARRLGLASRRQNGLLIVGASSWSIALASLLGELGVPVVLVDTSWTRLHAARLAGLRVHYGEILSELTEASLELNDIGYLLAATNNDAYNALVCTRFAPELGRNRVFQLPMYAADTDDAGGGVTPTMRGRIAFDAEAVHDELERRYYQGWRLQRTAITAASSYARARQRWPEGSLTLLVRRGDGGLVFNAPPVTLKPRPGDTVVSFQPPPAETVPSPVAEAGDNL